MPIYCELPLWGTIFEPLNTISNVAFLAAAFFVWRMAQEAGAPQVRRQQQILAVLLAAIGVGSGLWHYYRESWSLAADVIPIQLFLLCFTWFLLQSTGWARWQRGLIFAGFMATTVFGAPLVGTILPIAASGGGYAAALVFALVLAIFVYRTNPVQGQYFALSLLIFGISLTTRQLDLPTCDLTHQHGLHLFWHLINAYVLYRFALTLNYGKMTTLIQ